MKTPILFATVAGVALMSLGACDRDEALPTDATSMSAEDGAIDAVAITDDEDSDAARRAPAAASSSRASSAPSGATTSSGETMATGEGQSATQTGAGVANPVEEQMELTRETLSPGGASSGPTAPRPKD